MGTARLFAFLIGVLALTGGVVGQDPTAKAKKEDVKKEDAPAKVRGQLPFYWGQLGLSEDQKQKVYKVQARYGDEIEKLETKVRELREKMKKERYEVLSPEQQKRLDDVIKAKAGGKAEK